MNKKTGFKLLSLLLVLSLLFSMPFAASANTGDEIVPDGSITRVTYHCGDSKTNAAFHGQPRKLGLRCNVTPLTLKATHF